MLFTVTVIGEADPPPQSVVIVGVGAGQQPLACVKVIDLLPATPSHPVLEYQTEIVRGNVPASKLFKVVPVPSTVPPEVVPSLHVYVHPEVSPLMLAVRFVGCIEHKAVPSLEEMLLTTPVQSTQGSVVIF